MVLLVTGRGDPRPTLTWFIDDVAVNASADERISIDLVANRDIFRVTSILSIQNTVPSDSGQYVCVVSNVAGSVMTFFNVTVNGK